jgi:hypothetical protein
MITITISSTIRSIITSTTTGTTSTAGCPLLAKKSQTLLSAKKGK